ncbi:PREDICTED: methyl-CpG-binding domain protein 2-like [Sturnus vulgaris]|uniref:methyl-CpG-binding domain protein 2-like n=1 Tax=Sturnus vulgaris TaxID=9172 RepID=UPI00071A55E0|nr:PREDICTED: methyl-CpG-binding domain protein 2-like [Sturnus vulgaris]
MSRWFLTISSEGYSTPSLGNGFQSLVTHTVKKFFLVFKRNFPCFLLTRTEPGSHPAERSRAAVPVRGGAPGTGRGHGHGAGPWARGGVISKGRGHRHRAGCRYGTGLPVRGGAIGTGRGHEHGAGLPARGGAMGKGRGHGHGAGLSVRGGAPGTGRPVRFPRGGRGSAGRT